MNTQNLILINSVRKKDGGKNEKMKKMKAGIILAMLLFGIVWISGCMEQTTGSTGTNQPTVTVDDGYAKYKETLGIRTKFFEEMKERVPNRSTYGMPSEVFKALPVFAADFNEIKFLIEVGKFFDIGNLSENYWKQPEFYPRWEDIGMNAWKNPDPQHWCVVGYGTYPADQYVDTFPSGHFEVTAFFRSGWCVQTYQGIKLVTVYPVSAKSGDGITYTQSPAEAEKCFDVSISPNTFLLEPTYPDFKSEWVKKISVDVKVKPDCPKGSYVIAFDVSEPPQELSDTWFKTYLNMYSKGAGGISIGRSQLQIFAKVV